METTEARTINVEIPLSDWSFFVDLAKLRGWKTSRPRRKSGIDKGLDDLKAGRVYHAKDSGELLKQVQPSQTVRQVCPLLGVSSASRLAVAVAEEREGPLSDSD